MQERVEFKAGQVVYYHIHEHQPPLKCQVLRTTPKSARFVTVIPIDDQGNKHMYHRNISPRWLSEDPKP